MVGRKLRTVGTLKSHLGLRGHIRKGVKEVCFQDLKDFRLVIENGSKFVKIKFLKKY